MTSASPGWYPDPELAGGQRYFDGATWTEHRVGPAPYAQPAFDWWGRPAWKGAQLGRPQFGPGSLADPGRRLAARALDFLLLVPVFGLLLGVSLAIAAPHFGPIVPNYPQYDNSTQPPPGIVWVYLDVFACVVATGLVLVAYEAFTTVRYGRTVGKAWMHIRPLRMNGAPLTAGRAFGRVALYWVSMFLGWIGLLDPAWCLWDPVHQTLHDKIADTIVVNDGVPAGIHGPSAMMTGSWGAHGAQWPPTQWHEPQPQWHAPQWHEQQPQWQEQRWPQPQATPPQVPPTPEPPHPPGEPPSGDST